MQNKNFDSDYQMLEIMYNDSYYPDFLVDKIKDEILDVVEYLENEIYDEEEVLLVFEEMVDNINVIDEEFIENDSKLETGADESIGETISYIVDWFDLDLDLEDIFYNKEW